MKHKITQIVGFTLIETMVAITLLTVAIVAPMSLASQSLQSAYYARDQITASNLAQEGVEAVRALRDHNILVRDYWSGGGTPPDIFNGITTGSAFTIDPTNGNVTTICGGACPVLYTNNTTGLYGYTSTAGWTPTLFTRTIVACYLQSGGTCDSTASDEVRLTVTVSWKTGTYTKSFTISENLYRWIS